MGKKIAIIDDDIDIVDVLRFAFMDADYEIATTLRGEEAINMVKAFQPNVILLDVLLSGRDGRFICKELKTQKETKDIPVIMMSAHANMGESIAKFGADDFVAKPFDIDELINLVEKHINSQSS